MENQIAVHTGENEVEFVFKANSIQASNNNNEEKYYYAKKSKRDNVVAPWHACQLVEEIERIDNGNEKSFIVQFFNDNQRKDVAEYEMASQTTPKHDDLKKIGTRIIARRRAEEMPYRIDDSEQKIQLFASNDSEYYPGIIAGGVENRYMIFFDDGIVQLIKRKQIRRVLGDDRHNHAHWNAKEYFEFYLISRNRIEVCPEIGQKCSIEMNGNRNAKAVIQKIDTLMALVYFEEVKRYEWIYLGSPRIFQVFRELIKTKALDKMIQYKTYKTCRSANDDVVVIDSFEPDDEQNKKPVHKVDETVPLPAVTNNLKFGKHKCNHKCVSLEDDSRIQLEKYPTFQRPLLTGWFRLGKTHRFYKTPCGLYLHRFNDIAQYLLDTDSKLRIDSFELGKNCEIRLITKDTSKVEDDISRGVEKIPVPAHNKMSLAEKSFKYINGYNFDYIDVEPNNDLNRTGCNCTDNCRDKLSCSCWQLTIERLLGRRPKECDLKRNIEIAYKNMRHTEIVHSGVIECGGSCKCCADKCVNRVVQNGLQHELELFKTKNKGWGVKTATDIPAAMFVCEYAGDVLEDSTADNRSTKYQFHLSKFTIDSNGSDISDSDSEYEPKPKRFRDRSDDVVQPFLNYFPPSMQIGNANQFPEPEHNESRTKRNYIIDGLYHGNIARFINHGCDPNLFGQCVYVDDDTRFPRIAFFTSQPIKAGEELTIDYRCKMSPCFCDDCQSPK